MAIAGLLGGVAKTVAKDRAKSFITGRKKTVKPAAIKRGGGGEETPGEKGGALAVRPQASLVPAPADGFGLIRFTENGNREMDSVADLYDIVMSLDGMIGTWNYNFSAQFSNQLSNEYGYNYINKYAYAELAATPGFDPSLKANVDRYRHDTFERAENRYDNYFFGMGNDLTLSLIHI